MVCSHKIIVLVVTLVLSSTAGVHGDEHHHSRPLRDSATDVNNKAEQSATEDAAYWTQLGQQLLFDELAKQRINSQAKNIIVFLGDGQYICAGPYSAAFKIQFYFGMSISTVTAARIYKGQKAGKTGEEEQLHFDRFPYAALSKTYCTDIQVADSACTATAYLCGIKIDVDTLGLDVNVIKKNCSTQIDPANQVDSVMTWAQLQLFIQSGSQQSDGYRDYDTNSNTCDDIAEQLVLSSPGKNLKVILGGAYLTPTTTTDPETQEACRRRDGKNLIDQWVTDHPTGKYVTTRDELVNLDMAGTDFLLGGRIDQAHHDGRAKLALEEAFQFDVDVAAAFNLTNSDDTLIIVTADHSHTLTSDSFLQPAIVPLATESHGGDDVAIFALGPQAYLFQGVYEQHYIAHVMSYAACIGPGFTFCNNPANPPSTTAIPPSTPSSSSRIGVNRSRERKRIHVLCLDPATPRFCIYSAYGAGRKSQWR
ncbi:LOW QUALITY PROTEIN: hypothetical protein DAPPUDRAFT_269431 [Daphnia pulex]|uniref:Alkaline phosphatase n=1 Tax=Daphnia pulex TaxID=6669 RepID=E9HZC0_DAPPU|nr:LOW QUALITY PROTEIN: hypothetical protein DAPPUDRAFT_269431 [Daphnia pulex]|eukprot:EFX62911.1 LOW QUALITY PROTEIN: hypothetical protein DAPPUDRAFT_269431 [Daphnia pulex]